MVQKTSSNCPFCHAETKVLTQTSKTYACGTVVDRVLGIYQRGCGRAENIEQQMQFGFR